MSMLEPEEKKERRGSVLKRALSPFIRRESRREKLSKTSFESSQLKQLTFSTETIRFSFDGNCQTQYLVNKQLRIMNSTGTRIGFKIKSNNPHSYEVLPSQQRMEDGATCQIRFKLFLQNNTNLSKYSMDKFLVEWGRIDELTNLPVYSKQFNTILKVEMISDHNPQRNEQLLRSISVAEKEISLFMEVIDKNKSKIKDLEEEISRLENTPKPWIISQALGIFLAILAFSLGYFVYRK